MTPDELRTLADALEPMANASRFEDFDVPGFCAWVRACADEKPVGVYVHRPAELRYGVEWLVGDPMPNGTQLFTHPAPAAPAVAERGPWSADQRGRHVWVDSDDFTHDVRLVVNGDFESDDQKFAYAQEIARRLNAAPAAPQAMEDANVWKQIVPDDEPQAEPKHGINWQPIETAPRDNKRPLLLASFDDRGVLSNVDFNGSWECESESWEMPQEYYFWDSANGMADEPTHWAYQPEGFAQLTKETAAPQAVRIDPHMIVAEDRFPDEQAEPKREPLSDEQVLILLRSLAPDVTANLRGYTAIVRAVERHHGIGDSDAE